MTAPLLSVGPTDAAADEQAIADGYRKNWWLLFGAAIPLGLTAYFGDLKWVVALGFVSTIAAINGAEGRLYDLCIRLRRTNILLTQKSEDAL